MGVASYPEVWGEPEFVGARANRTANQTLNSASTTALSWDTEEFDSHGFVDVGGANPARFTVPSGKGGKYFIEGSGYIGASTAGTTRWSAIFKNGTALTYNQKGPNSTSTSDYLQVKVMVDASPGDYFELRVHQDSGTVLVTGGGAHASFMSMARIAPPQGGGVSGGGGGSSSSTAFTQGGNSFGTLATLGTLDANDLVVKAGNTEIARFTNAGGYVGARSFAPGAVTTITANTTLDASHHFVRCNNTGAITVTLPAAAGISGRVYQIKRVNTGVVTVDGNASETIDGATMVTITNQYDSYSLISNGTSWDII